MTITKIDILLHPLKVIYACNVADGDLAEGNDKVQAVREFADKEGASVVVVSAQVESELVDLDGDDKREFLESLGSCLYPLVCWREFGRR